MARLTHTRPAIREEKLEELVEDLQVEVVPPTIVTSQLSMMVFVKMASQMVVLRPTKGLAK